MRHKAYSVSSDNVPEDNTSICDKSVTFRSQQHMYTSMLYKLLVANFVLGLWDRQDTGWAFGELRGLGEGTGGNKAIHGVAMETGLQGMTSDLFFIISTCELTS